MTRALLYEVEIEVAGSAKAIVADAHNIEIRARVL